MDVFSMKGPVRPSVSQQPFSQSHLSASMAAMAPVPAEVMAWRYTGSATSPAAYTPVIDVWVVPGTV